jgi:hypothetical protein
MSDEIISISSPNGDGSTIVEVLPVLPVLAEPSELGLPSAVINCIIHVNDLDTFLCGKPRCLVKQTKHRAD